MKLPKFKFALLITGCLLGLTAAAASAEPQMIDVTPEGAEISHVSGLNARGDLFGNAQYSSYYEGFVHRDGITETLSLGGSESYASDMNESGSVVGEGENAAGEWHGFVSGREGMLEIPAMPGMEGSSAFVINNSGQVAGISYRDSDGYSEAFLYTNGELTPITLGGARAWPHAINSRGDVFGTASPPDGSFIPHLWRYETAGFIHTAGETIAITLPGGLDAIPVALNDAGDALVNVVFEVNGFIRTRGALYHAASGQVIDLVPGAPESVAKALNLSGDVVGYLREPLFGDFLTHPRALLYRDGQTINIAPPGAVSSLAELLSESGDVVVRGNDANGPFLAIWRNGTLIPIVLDGYHLSATSINEIGDVVGIAFPATSGGDSLGFLWRDGQVAITSPGPTSDPALLNGHGDVVGRYYDASSGATPAYRYRDGLVENLGTLGGSSSRPSYLNERGFIAGVSSTSSEVQDAFLVHGNRPPTAGDDSAYAQLNQSVVIPVLDNDADAEADPLEIVAVTQPAHGTAVLSADGTVTYTATEAFSGFDTFTYTISDGLPGTTSATVYVALWAEALSSAVTDLVESGASLPADGKSLLLLLQNADYASIHGSTTIAVGKLNAFIAQTEAFVKSGKLTVSQGEDLIEVAEAAIASLAG